MNFWFKSFVIFWHFFNVTYCNIVNVAKFIREDDVEKVQEFLYDRFRHRVMREITTDGENVGGNEVLGMESQILLDSYLHYAVTKMAPKVVRLMLACGADVNANLNGGTPMHLMAKKPHGRRGCSHIEKSKQDKVVDVLLEYNPDVHVKDGIFYTPLMRAVYSNNVSLVAKLLARGSDICERTKINGETVLHVAVRRGCLKMAKLLLKNGAEPYAVDSFGRNALHLLFGTNDIPPFSTRAKGIFKLRANLGKLLLRLERAEEMLTQTADMKTPVDVFFQQNELNREILLDMLKMLPSLPDKYVMKSLRAFSPFLEENSITWPSDNFPEYVKIALTSYVEMLLKSLPKKTFYLDFVLAGIMNRITGKKSTPTECDCALTFFIEHDVYSLYVILKTCYQHHRQDREDAADDVENFEKYLRGESVTFQNSLVNVFSKGTILDFLPTHLLSNIFLRSHFARNIERLSIIMALVQFLRGWSEQDMLTSVKPAFIKYIERRSRYILL